ncbi:tetratricopeptide repeat protein [Desulfofundulus thermosubterraneus]|uniref:Tetratricopeptide repeat-containing protein n=1 Tax=Desulfofundulus thermosubterraneus DSM 16057 TaxID=1121432 RepID=A0A1M6DH45_9FIRM|nr:tetratricopeptide repeat protein [Desulfofundulus thermosubterraneus]SHI72515.1 Tetratricopeptide repeat-containing protein [Desulfofundulus thermosubterraneus DSM 16057]
MWNPLPALKRQSTLAVLWQVGARILEALGADEQALRWIDRAMRLEPRQATLHLHATRLCLKRGRLDRAILHWKKVAGEQGKTSLLYWLKRTNQRAFNASRLIQKTGTYSLEEKEKNPAPPVKERKNSLPRFLGRFGDIFQRHPDTPPLDEIGVQLLEIGRAEQALAVFRQVQLCQGASPELYLNMGLAASKLGRHEEALEYYQRAQAGGLNNVEIMNNKGYSLSHLGRYEEAIACYELAKEMCPGDAAILSNLASCYHRAQLYQKALSCYENALRCSSNDTTTLNNYALCLDEMGRHGEALQFYDRALAVDPDNQTILLNKAACLVKLKRYDEAIAICDQILARKPGCLETWGMRGNVLNEMGRTSEAVECYNRALSLSSKKFAGS